MSFKDSLASLFDPAPAPEVDPEAMDLDEKPATTAEPLELHADRKPSRAAAEKPRLRADIQLDGEAYRGKRSSRAAVFGEEDEKQMNGFLSGSDEELASDINDDADEDADAAAHMSDDDDQQGQQQQQGDDDAADDDAADSEDEATAAARAALQASSAALAAKRSTELAALEAEYEQAEAQDAAALASMKQHSEKERLKSRAVRHQRSLWERSLELRILLQKPFASSNRLPQPSVRAAALAQSTELQQQYSQLLQSSADTLKLLLELQQALLSNNPSIGAAAGEAPKAGKRSRAAFEADQAGCAAVWAEIERQQAVFAPYCDESLDKWHRRTVLSSGSAALRNNLRALNQSISSQVAAVMKDPSRFIERSQLERSSSRPLCHQAAAEQQQEEEQEARDPETFDDSEFYQLLLKEFLEAGSGAGSKFVPVKAEKKRKKVDRRASKGRKIRYHVHEKLVNFMTASSREQPAFAEQLFANLFGHAA